MAVATKHCRHCGLDYPPKLGHGLVDCLAELRAQVFRLQRECATQRVRADIAEDTLHNVKAALIAGDVP